MQTKKHKKHRGTAWLVKMLKISNLVNRRLFSCSCVVSKSGKDDSIGSRLHELLNNMSKEKVNKANVMKVRMEKRPKYSSKDPSNSKQPTTIYWQVLGNGSYGGAASLLVHTNHKKYLFNCGEGTQRLSIQLAPPSNRYIHSKKVLGQLGHVFITSKTWRYLGGLPGVCLSARGARAKNITIHGPPGCMELYEATKGFLTLFDFDVHAHTADDGEFDDGVVKVEQVVLHSNPRYKECPDLPENWKGDEHGKWEDYDTNVNAYICKFNHMAGELDIDKCVDLGVKPGPMLTMLKNGKDVTLSDGSVVRSCQVRDTAPPSCHLVLDIPDMDYLCSLETCDKLLTVDNLETVFHFSPHEVVTSPRYKQWMDRLGNKVNHIVLNENCRGLGLPNVTAFTHKLRMIKGDFFPALVGAEDPLANTDMENQVVELNTCVIPGMTGLKYHVRPHRAKKLDYSEVRTFDKELSVRELLEGINISDPREKEEYVKSMKEDLRSAAIFNPDPLKNLTAKLSAMDGVNMPAVKKYASTSYPVVTFLGTGSSVPGKYRNVAGILVETEPGSFLMLDCGEGTMSQLVRMRGREGAERVLMGLKGVYISHLHADHHLGLVNIILLRERAFISRDMKVKKLYILSTHRLAEYLTTYHSMFEPLLCNAELVKCEQLVLYNLRDDETFIEDPSGKHQLIFPETLQRVLSELGLVELYTSKALHCPHSFCLAFRTSSGYKLAYTGDTRPFQPFRDICAWGGAPDLLIHEATLEHFMMSDAIIKKHSTITEAIQEGRNMGAKFTMLTHFSQRYSKMPPLSEIEGNPNVGIAFDNMVVRPDTMKLIPGMYPALVRFLREYHQRLHDNAEHYKAKWVEGGHLVTQLDKQHSAVPGNIKEKAELIEKLAKQYEEKTAWIADKNRRRWLEKQQDKEAGAKKRGGKRDKIL